MNWGYRLIEGAESPEDENHILDSWIEEKAGDPIYRFASSTGYDPSAQTEDLSDDPIKASTYGLMNLKRVVPNLVEWTSTDGQGYDDLEEIYNELIFQWSRYARHVSTNVGGVYQNRLASDQEGMVYTPVDADYQKAAVAFLNEHAFTTPDWLLDEDILRRIEHAGAIESVKNLQARILTATMNPGSMTRLVEQEAIDNNAYTLLEMLADIRKGIWDEIYQNNEIDAFRRALQREYISYVHSMFETDVQRSRSGSIDIKDSDIRAALRAELNTLQTDIRRARISDAMTSVHLDDIDARIDAILDNE